MIVSEVNIKLAILGTGGVGKTSIVQSYLGKEIPSIYIPTIGSNIVSYILFEDQLMILLGLINQKQEKQHQCS